MIPLGHSSFVVLKFSKATHTVINKVFCTTKSAYLASFYLALALTNSSCAALLAMPQHLRAIKYGYIWMAQKWCVTIFRRNMMKRENTIKITSSMLGHVHMFVYPQRKYDLIPTVEL